MGMEQMELSDSFPAKKERWLMMIVSQKHLHRCLPLAIVIAKHLNNETHAWRLRISTIMKATKLSRRAVQMQLALLEEAELLYREYTSGASEFTFGDAFYERERELGV